MTVSVNGPFPPDLPLPQMLLLGDSAGAGVFVGIFPVFAGKNLVLIAKSKYNYQVVAHVPQGSKEPSQEP